MYDELCEKYVPDYHTRSLEDVLSNYCNDIESKKQEPQSSLNKYFSKYDTKYLEETLSSDKIDKFTKFDEIKKYNFLDKIIDRTEYLKTLKENNLNKLNDYILTRKNITKIHKYNLEISLTVSDSIRINSSNLGEFAFPIVNYIYETRPDYIVACDRGARFLGLAVFKLYHKLFGRLPTVDATLRFRRFSKSNSEQETINHIRPLVNEMLKHKSHPDVLVIEDWIISGKTKEIIKKTFDELSNGKINVRFAVLVGAGADVSGTSSSTSGFGSLTDWHDDSNIIGVRYSKNDRFNYEIDARPVISAKSRRYRKKLYCSIDNFLRKAIHPKTHLV